MFDNYVVRRVEERDRAYLDKLIANDPHHKDVMSAEFFLRTVPGEDAWACEDKQGRVLLYFKTATAVRLAIQFAEGEIEENREVLTKGMAWLEVMFIRNKFREIIFDTTGAALRIMAKRRLGFVETSDLLVRPLPSQEDFERAIGSWHHEPSPCAEGG